MALADYDAYVNALRLNRGADWQMSGATARAGRPNAIWGSFLPTPAPPTTSVALDRNSSVAIGPIPEVASGNELCILGGRFNTSGAGGVTLVAIDLLNHHNGMSGATTGEQTTNLVGSPASTAALTRYTSGEGVMIGLVVYTQLGSTATTVTVRYTNSAGTGNRVSTATTIGGSGFREGGALILIPLEGGDTGVRSVEGVTLAATTGGGTFGVCLFKPLAMFALNDVAGAMPLDAVSSGGMVGQFALVHPDACLTLMAIPATNQSINGTLLLAEV